MIIWPYNYKKNKKKHFFFLILVRRKAFSETNCEFQNFFCNYKDITKHTTLVLVVGFEDGGRGSVFCCCSFLEPRKVNLLNHRIHEPRHAIGNNRSSIIFMYNSNTVPAVALNDM